MKLESLKNDKFEAFKGNEIQNAMKIVGGSEVSTTINGGNPDCYDYSTNSTHTTDGAGKPRDFWYRECKCLTAAL